MTTVLKFLTADIIIQRILAAVYLFTGLFALIERQALIFLLIVQFFLGGWQLLSSIIHTAIRRDKNRMSYFFVVLTYFVILFAGSTLASQNIIPESDILIFVSFILCPMSIAIWYFITSEKDYLAAKQLTSIENKENTTPHRQILDEGLWK